MYDLAPPKTSFLNDIFGIENTHVAERDAPEYGIDDTHAEERDHLGFDPDYKARILASIRKMNGLNQHWSPMRHLEILHLNPRGNRTVHAKSAAIVISYIASDKTWKNKVFRFNQGTYTDRSVLEADVMSFIDGQQNIYVQQQGCRNWRKGANLAYTSCHYIDIDRPQIPPDRYHNRYEYIAEVIAKLVYAGLPEPSYVMDSGQGFNLMWAKNFTFTTHSSQSKIHHAWNRMQARLMDVFDLCDIKYDPKPKDVMRIFRLAGTKHGKVKDHLVRPCFISGQGSDNPTADAPIHYYSNSEMLESLSFALDKDEYLDDIALGNDSYSVLDDEDLGELPLGIPLPSAKQIEDFEKETPFKVVPDAVPDPTYDEEQEPNFTPVKTRHVSTWIRDALNELRIYAKYKYPNGINENRDTFVHLATAMTIASLDLRATDVHAQRTQNDIVNAAMQDFIDLCDNGIERDRLIAMQATAIERLAESRSGKVSVFNGKAHTPRYTYKRTTIIQQLGITRSEMVALGFRCLVDDDLRAQHKRDAKARSRGQQTPAKSKDERRAEMRSRHATITETFKDVGTVKGTADALSMCRKNVRKVLRENGLI